MRKIYQTLLILFVLTLLAGSAFASINISIYSESLFQYYKPDDQNLGWKLNDFVNNPKLYFELKISGTVMKDLYFWTKLGSENNDSDLEFNTWEVHLQYKFKNFFGGSGELILYQNQARFYLGTPIYKDLVNSVGADNKRTGLWLDSGGIFGLSLIKAFVVDGSASRDDSLNTDFGIRIRKDILNNKIKIGATQNIAVWTATNNTDPNTEPVKRAEQLYSMTAFDLQVTAIPMTYLGFEIARTYAPWLPGYDPYKGKDVGGKAVLTFSYDARSLGQFNIMASATVAGPFFSLARGAGDMPDESLPWSGVTPNTDRVIEFLEFNYNFPLKAIYLKSNIKYSHRLTAWPKDEVHLWEANETIEGTHISYSDNYAYIQNFNQLYIEFVNGFNFKTYVNRVLGRNIKKNIIGDWTDVMFELQVENKYGKIKPQIKMYNVGDPSYAAVAYGGEMLINITKELKLYSRFAIMSAMSERGGRYESNDGSKKSWGSMYIELQAFPIGNCEMYLRFGDGGASEHLAETFNLIQGDDTVNRIEFQVKYWF